jgi:hypothetical protein
MSQAGAISLPFPVARPLIKAIDTTGARVRRTSMSGTPLVPWGLAVSVSDPRSWRRNLCGSGRKPSTALSKTAFLRDCRETTKTGNPEDAGRLSGASAVSASHAGTRLRYNWSSCRGSAYRPSASPSDRGMPAPHRASRSGRGGATCSARARRPLRPCLSDRDPDAANSATTP